ncbi:hypothetical protein [Chitinophaga sp. Cy-1792]|uniref:hypothetical protein n=1 Tax=Chitinophaga sp. Cy-1792 TaxID=2608339 RepID=UPI001420D51B|nr:hypothetical protein [Chitinophaga sp. Cy-1792]
MQNQFNMTIDNRIKLFFFPDPQKKYVAITYFSISLLILQAIGVTIAWFQLPKQIPLSFGFFAKETIGDKSGIWVLVLVPVILFLVFTTILQSSLIEHTFKGNFYDNISNDSSTGEASKSMIYYLRAAVVLIFSFLAILAYLHCL